ncbi:hypothetical protein DQ04_01541070 [Trypanosoma grayi]|uniref:hypothetical protein n=1 Tax=Trypanosoma grayi TaxID=71804 RepID=UPI0004F40B78|nr:hypothetical protein DQ04_01541070 [Trypanosoma grayi]KEG12667.1 hypothetical protein DQ04_01541070 [Trypanosoma grayi]
MVRCDMPTLLSLLLLVLAAVNAAAAAATTGVEASVVGAGPQCAWVFSADEGATTTSVLRRQWDYNACAGQYLTVATRAPVLPGFVIPNAHFAAVQYKPAMTGLREGEVRYVSQQLTVTCDVFTPLCAKAEVYYVIHGAVPSPSNTTTTEAPTEPNNNTTTTTTTTEAPTEPNNNTTTTPTTSTEAPTEPNNNTTTTTEAPTIMPPRCPATGVPPLVEANLSESVRLEPLRYVDNCAAPQRLVMSSSTSSSNATDVPPTNYFSIEKDVILWFDRNATNNQEGLFSANLTVYCGGVPSCYDVQVQVLAVRRPLTPPPTELPPDCGLTYGYRVDFEENARLVINPHAEDACPVGTNTTFTLVTAPKYNPDRFRLNQSTGVFYYAAPAGPQIKTDAFVFVIGCTSATGSTSKPKCMGHGSILVTAASPPSEEEECPGYFVFTYSKNNGGTEVEESYSLIRAADNSSNASFCSGGNYTGAQLRAPAANGTVTDFNNNTGEFHYIASGDTVDYFEFTLTCVTKDVCYGTATMQPRAPTPIPSPTPTPTTTPEGPRPVYDLDSIVCRGTCDAAAWLSSPRYPSVFDVTDGPRGDRSHVTPRRDGKAPDAMDFEVRVDGQSLVLRAYTTIGNMAARFVTFAPLRGSGSEYLTSAYLPKDAGSSFNATCLDHQANFGLASSIWTWDGDDDEESDNNENKDLRGHLNSETGEYVSGENYFHKFGGKHRECDVFRTDPCKYAPMLTPSSAGIAGTDIDWKLYVNDCDATWVGNITLERLRLLRNSTTGMPLFKLVNGSMLVGTIYSQVVKPASWSPPYNGILSMQRAYTVRIFIGSSIGTAVDISPEDVTVIKEGDVTSNHTMEEATQTKSAVEAAAALNASSLQGRSENMSPFNVSVDVRFAAAIDPLTGERLYGYSLMLYPYRLNYSDLIYSVPKLDHLNATQLHVKSVDLLNMSWVTPNPLYCPECTGKATTCKGTGTGLNLDCDPIIRFEPIGQLPIFPQEEFESGREGQFLNISLVARVVGNDTSLSAAGDPQGSFALLIGFVNGLDIAINVQQIAHIRGINLAMRGSVCRSSAYWPVPDTLGTSVPINPFNATQMLNNYINWPLDGAEADEQKPYYGAPRPLHPDTVCVASSELRRPERVVLNSTTASVYPDEQGAPFMKLAMCAATGGQVYGVTDWVYVSLDDITSGAAADFLEHISLEYLILSIDAWDVMGVLLPSNVTKDAKQLHFVLDGASLPDVVGDDVLGKEEEKQKWMGDVTDANTQVFLPWEKYAAYLRYRRIDLRPNLSPNKTTSSVVNSFHFAFVPGALLHRHSNTRAVFHLRAALRFTSSGGSGESRVEEYLFTIPVSAQISSELRFDRDAYTPQVTPKKSGGLSKKSATALFIVLAVAIVAVLSAAFYVETHYNRVLRSAKRRLRKQLASGKADAFGSESPQRPREHFSPLVDHPGDFSMSGGTKSIVKAGGKAEESKVSPAQATKPTTTTPVTGIKTSYGVVQIEQSRTQEQEEGSSEGPSLSGTLAVRVEETHAKDDASRVGEDLK